MLLSDVLYICLIINYFESLSHLRFNFKHVNEL